MCVSFYSCVISWYCTIVAASYTGNGSPLCTSNQDPWRGQKGEDLSYTALNESTTLRSSAKSATQV